MPRPKNNLRYIVACAGSEESIRFTKSHGGAESIYTTFGVAKRQAQEVGDRIYEIDFTSLAKSYTEGFGGTVPYKLVFTREPKKLELSAFEKALSSSGPPNPYTNPPEESSGETYGIGPDGEYYTRDASGNTHPW